MRQRLKWKIILLAAFTALGLVYLLPSFPGLGDFPCGDWPLCPRKVNLGLDLQGGMHLVLQVVADKAVETAADRTVQGLRRDFEQEKIDVERMAREGPTKIRLKLAKADQVQKLTQVLGLLVGWDRAPGADQTEVLLTLRDTEAQSIRDRAVQQSLTTIRNRVDQFGVTEPHIVPEGTDRIVVQLPGIKEPERAINLIGRTARLEFKAVDEQGNLAEALQGKLPEGDQILYERRTDERGGVSRTPILVRQEPILTGDALTAARAEIDPGFRGWLVSFELDAVGARVFGEFTEKNIGRRLAIVLDDVVYSAPVVRSAITAGRGQITGNFTEREAADLAIVLRAGALPAPVNIISNLTVGPSLGQDSIRAGVRASILAAVLVVILMAVYYRWSGVLADLALSLNLIMTVGALALIRATLTLPGIAGIALTIGMAVDTNVLIFERIREELRLGKTVRAAVEAGFDRAFVAIIDSHVTTLITAFALFLFGTGPVRGFAVTLSLGVAINLFTAIVGTRVVFDWITLRRALKRLSI
jgi:preprotein translocase subunit SecD